MTAKARTSRTSATASRPRSRCRSAAPSDQPYSRTPADRTAPGGPRRNAHEHHRPDWGTVALAVALAFLFGYALTSLPLLRAGFALAAVIPIALASDTLSIAVMEVVDNAIMLAVPGAMESGAGSVLFWGSLSFALVIAGAVAYPFNRWLIARGKGHAVVHETGVHGGPSPRAVGAVAAVAFVFGIVVLTNELLALGDSAGHNDSGALYQEHE